MRGKDALKGLGVLAAAGVAQPVLAGPVGQGIEAIGWALAFLVGTPIVVLGLSFGAALGGWINRRPGALGGAVLGSVVTVVAGLGLLTSGLGVGQRTEAELSGFLLGALAVSFVGCSLVWLIAERRGRSDDEEI